LVLFSVSLGFYELLCNRPMARNLVK